MPGIRSGVRTGFAVVAVALIAAATALLPAVAGAHAAYERSFPGSGAVVPVAPARVDVWYTQEMFNRLGANSIEVDGPDGSRADKGDFVLDDNDRKHASVGLKLNLPPGVYTVRWTTLSAVDGDPAEGSFTFTIDPNASALPSATVSAAPAAASTATGGGITPPRDSGNGGDSFPLPLWSVIAAGAMLTAGALGVWALLGPEQKEGA